MRALPRFQAFALAAAMVGACNGTWSLSAVNPASIDVVRQMNEVFVGVADRCTPTVVVVQVAQKIGSPEGKEDHPFLQQMPEELRKQYEEFLQRQRRRRDREGPQFNGEGSGIVYREDGYILTNAHVVAEAERIRIKLHDGREFDAEVRGTDPDSDIAILRIKDKVSGLRSAKFGNSDKVRVGEFAIAIGAPYELEYSVTFGHISAKGRAGLSQDMMDEDFLQTDANINPGNSGGPLMNLEGEVIGVNSMIRGVGTGICFAIPANLAREVADQLVDSGKFQRSWLGVGIKGLREDERLRKRYPSLTNGVVVTGISEGGPAEKADLKDFDVITAVDGRPVGTITQLRREITRKRPGSDVALDVHRGGKELKIQVQPAAMPDLEQRIAMSRPPGRQAPDESTLPVPPPAAPTSNEALGLKVQTTDETLSARFKLGTAAGVVVTEVDESGPLAEYGFRVGDLIYEVDKKAVKTSSQFSEALRAAADKKKFTLRYQRSGEKLSAVVLTEKTRDKDGR
jgi:serine protease Do